jgi:hypothetical protein
VRLARTEALSCVQISDLDTVDRKKLRRGLFGEELHFIFCRGLEDSQKKSHQKIGPQKPQMGSYHLLRLRRLQEATANRVVDHIRKRLAAREAAIPINNARDLR